MMTSHTPTMRSTPTVQIPPWNPSDDPTVDENSPFSAVNFTGNAVSPGDHPHSPSPFLDSFAPLHRHLPSNAFDSLSDEVDSPDTAIDAFSCDEFRMYEFKVRRCVRARAHDWTDCPFAHPGEKARRRDPRKYHYSGTACPEYRKGNCRKGEACEYAHGVFECWLHPARYRTQPCKDGTSCRRRVCFFAHTPEQLRILPRQGPIPSDDFEMELFYGRRRFESSFFTKPYVSSPTSILISPSISPPSDSPPMSPAETHLISSMRKLQLEKSKMNGSLIIGSGFGSPRCSMLRTGFGSSPTTPSRTPPCPGLGGFEIWDGLPLEEEPMTERVESGKELRAKMYARLCKENSLDRVDSTSTGGPSVGWLSEVAK